MSRPSADAFRASASFIDLREFSRDASNGSHAVRDDPQAGGDPFSSGRRVLDLPPGPVTIGVWSPPTAAGFVESQSADEFLVVCEGQLTLTQGDQPLVLRPGQAVVLQHGSEFSWACDAPASILFMRYGDSTAGDQRVVAVSEAPALQLSDPPAAGLLIGPAPICRSHVDHCSADGTFVCGTWDSTPYHRHPMLYRHYEMMSLRQGSVTFKDEAGRQRTFSKGDIFLIEQHASCSWESQEDVAKVYAVYRP